MASQDTMLGITSTPKESFLQTISNNGIGAKKMFMLKQMHEAYVQEETKDVVDLVVAECDLNSRVRSSHSKRKIKKKMRNKSTKRRKQDRC